jgi:hypothetical protein
MTDTDVPDLQDPQNVIPPTELERRRRVLACIEDLADLSSDIADRIRELRDMGVPAADWMQLLASHAPEVVQSLYQQYGSFVAGAVDGFLDARAAGAKTGMEGMMAAFASSIMRKASAPSPIADVAAELAASGAKVTIGAPPPSGYEHPPDLTSDGYYTDQTLRIKRVLDRLFAEAPKLTDASGSPDPTQAPALECHVMLRSGGAIQGALSVTPEGTLRMLCPNQIGKRPVMVEHFFDYEQIADIALFREVKAGEGPRIITS